MKTLCTAVWFSCWKKNYILTKSGFQSRSRELQRNAVRSAPINLTGSKWKDEQVRLCRLETWQKIPNKRKQANCGRKVNVALRTDSEQVLGCWNEGQLAGYAAPYSIAPEEWITQWHHISPPQRLPLWITARLYHFRWQLGQIACHSASIWQNRWLIPGTLAQPSSPIHYLSLFAATEMCSFGLRRYCTRLYPTPTQKNKTVWVFARVSVSAAVARRCYSCSSPPVSVSALFTCLYTKMCHSVYRPVDS